MAFSTADYNAITVGETVTGGNTQPNTTVSSKAIVGGQNVITLSKNESSSSPSGTPYVFSGLIVPGSTISSIAASGESNKNITISNAVLSTIAQFEEISFGTGNVVNSNLSVVMLETAGTNSSSEITTVNNKKALLTGTITLNQAASSAVNITITPNFLTVS